MSYLKELLTISLGMFLSTSSFAGVYQWTDENGKIHFSDTKPEVQNPSAAVKTLKIRGGGGYAIPVVEQLQVIPYTGYENPLAFSLADVKLNIENADYQRVKIGQLLSGPRCNKKVKDIHLNDGNGYFSNRNIANSITTEIKKAGYNLGKSLAAFDKQNQRLTLKAELISVKLNSCIKSKDTTSQNETYIKVKWQLDDKLLRETVYSSTSEGTSNNATHSDKSKSTRQAISSSFAIATKNLLADPLFVKHINTTKAPEPLITSYSPLAVNLVYSTDDSSFRQQLKNLQDSTTTVRNTEGHGSGVVISADGYVLTNAHVVGKDKELIVIYKNREYTATVVRQEPVRDIALLKIETTFPFSTSSISKTLPGVGDKLFAIGSPLSEALSHTVTSGILSANRTKHGLKYYQTDTTINPGNSGGPVYNEAGQLVAISVSGIVSAGGSGVGINYLIPIVDAFASLSIKTRPASLTAPPVVATKTSQPKKPGLLDRVIALFGGDNNSEDKSSEDNTTKKEDDSGKKSDWDKAYALYQQALIAKEKEKYDEAEEFLLIAVTSIDYKDLSSDAYRLRDELYFHLPVAKAREMIKSHKTNKAKIAIKNVNQYLSDHPKRFEYMAHINKINSSIEYLSLALSTQAKAQLAPLRQFITEYYFDKGELPNNVHDMSKLLEKHMGHQLTNKFQLINYKRKNQNFVFLFEDKNSFEQHEIIVAIN